MYSVSTILLYSFFESVGGSGVLGGGGGVQCAVLGRGDDMSSMVIARSAVYSCTSKAKQTSKANC